MATILGIESSCDDTSVAIVADDDLLAHIVLSQEDHAEWGGVVPEIASRSHLTAIGPLLRAVMNRADVSIDRIDAVAVTNRPGLVGSLLVGLNVAKGIAASRQIPLIAVNHIEAHLLSVQIEQDVPYPYCALLVSGGHTMIYDVVSAGEQILIGATRDDAAGEAFDKGAKILGLGYPGGPIIEQRAEEGNPGAIRFPRGLTKEKTPDFSFSGLKTALRYHVRDHYGDGPIPDSALPDICASYQEAIVDVLVSKTIDAAAGLGRHRVALVGGVAANSALRRRMIEECGRRGISVVSTSSIYSTDNAAMIALVGSIRFGEQAFDSLDITASSSLPEAKARRSRNSPETHVA